MVHQLSLKFTKDCANNSVVGAWFDNAVEPDYAEYRAWRNRRGFAMYNSNLQVNGFYYVHLKAARYANIELFRGDNRGSHGTAFG